MNTSAKGAAYENAFKRELLSRKGVVLVSRAAASKGRFDLISLENDGGEWFTCLYQLKSGPLSCKKARELMLKLYSDVGMPPSWSRVVVGVVHRTTVVEFCEH